MPPTNCLQLFRVYIFSPRALKSKSFRLIVSGDSCGHLLTNSCISRWEADERDSVYCKTDPIDEKKADEEEESYYKSRGLGGPQTCTKKTLEGRIRRVLTQEHESVWWYT